jgi:2-amino-4-hydroxy-6-hydroxymethyldihydropteridine diphosphokinase
MTAHRAYLGIGANLGEAAENVTTAIAALEELGAVLSTSPLYRSQPWGVADQPPFVNAVVLLETPLDPRALLDELWKIERRLGRTPGERWGPRAIDLDLLLYDDLKIDSPELHVPHKHLRDRAFVLVPLAQLDDRFAPWRDALDASELAGVVPLPRSDRSARESVTAMPQERLRPLVERIAALARFLASDDAVRVRVSRGEDAIELARRLHPARASRSSDGVSAELAPLRVDEIKADIVGIFHARRPAPVEGDRFEGDRELGYIEALGIRTPVRSMGAGRIVSVATDDGAAVEYGQALFLVARG